jgi:hypothetical protein
MKNKIIIEGQEFELPQSLVDEIKERLTPKVKKLTYKDIARELFPFGTECFWATERGTIRSDLYCVDVDDPNTASSKKQVEKLLAINKMMNVAKFLNKCWKFKCSTNNKYAITLDSSSNKILICTNQYIVENNIYFESEKLAQQCIDILGEDVIKLALSTDW